MPRREIVLLSLLSLSFGGALVACNGGNSDASDASIAVVSDATAPSPGASYIVPAGPDTPQLSYALDTVMTEVNAGTFRIDYNMPQLLVGGDQQVSLRGTVDAAGRMATVSGDAGTATCDLMPGGGVALRCSETLTGIVVNLAGVVQITQFMAPSTASVYVAVASHFSGEPIGIVELR